MNQQANSSLIPKALGSILWLIIFAVMFAWRSQNLDAFGLSNDEGAHLMWARLALDGFPLYSETHAAQAPLFLESVAWAFRLAGQSIQTGRWVTLIGFGLLALALSWLAYQAGGWLASLTTLILAGTAPLLFTFSRLVMAEVTATAMAVVAVALVVPRTLFGKRRWWLLFSGMALGLSFIVKALNPFVVGPIGFLMLVGRSQNQSMPVEKLTDQLLLLNKQWRAFGTDLLYWGVGVCLPLVAVLVLYDMAAVYDQLIAFRGDLRAAIPGSWTETRQQFRIFISSHWGLWLLGLGAIGSTILRSFLVTASSEGALSEAGSPQLRPSVIQPFSFVLYNLTWGIWLAAGVMMLAWHTPLFPHHFVVLLPPLILLGAGLMADLVVFWQYRPKDKRAGWGLIAALLFIIVAAVFSGPDMVRTNQKTAAIVTGGREQESLRLLEAVSNPADFLMGDSQLLIFMAGRRTPPPLGDVALVAIKAQRQTSARMIDLTASYQSPAVVSWSLRLPWLPDYLTWVEANYLARQVWDNDHIIYFARRLAEGEAIPNERSIRLGSSLALRGFQLDAGSVQAEQDINLKVYWQTDGPLSNEYTIFTQVLDHQGALVAGQDSQPLGGYFPTSQWPDGEIIIDVVHLSLPAELPAGTYTLITGMYLLETLERLPVADHGGDYIMLTTITVE